MHPLINKTKKNISPSSLLFTIYILLFLIPRFIVFLTKSDYFNGDFAFYYFLTRDIVINHKFPLIGHVVGEIGGFAQGPGWSYLLTIPFIVFNGDPYGGKVFMLIVSVTILLSGSLLAWKYFGKIEGLLIGFFLGSSPYLIRWTNIAWPPYIVPLIFISYLFFLSLFLLNGKKRFFYLMATSLGLISHFEIASLALIFPSFLLLVFFFVYKSKINKIDIIKSLIVFSTFFIPHLIYDLSKNFYNLKGLLSLIQPNSNNTSLGFPIILADRLHLFKTDLIAIFTTSNYKFLVICFIFLLYGFSLFVRDKKVKSWKKIFISHILLSISLTFLGVCLIPVERASFWWFTYLTIIYIFFAGVMMGYLFKRNLFNKLIIIFVIGICLNLFLQNIKILISKQKEMSKLNYEIRIQEPIEYIYKNSNNEPFTAIFVTGEEKIIDYKYMLWFVGKNEYKNSKSLKNLDLNYTNGDGIPIFLNEEKQFNNLKKGIYYIIIKNSSLEINYVEKNLKNRKNFTLISSKEIKNMGKNLIIEKIRIN